MCGLALAAVSFGAKPALADQPPLKVGYSDWPGWVAWDVAINKGWLKEAGVNVQFQWFDYSASLDAFAAGKPVRPRIQGSSCQSPRAQR